MIKILIADDHKIMREGLKQLFALTEDVVVAGEATNGGQVLEQLRNHHYDLLLLDVSMPGINGDELIKRIHDRYPGMPILVLSMHNEPKVARSKLQAGALGYLTKDSDPQMLIDAIRKVAKGKRFISAELAERMAFAIDAELTGAPHERLSRRELHILRLLVKGDNVTCIARELAISDKTVSSHKARLMKKLGIDSNAKLVRYAVENGLVE